jgi:hypothetical protein
MVICPWCGTAYTAFQSNCQRCGGPLMAADQATEQPREGVDEGEPQGNLTQPPPAPRPISDSYAWRLIIGEGWVVAALIVASIGAVFFVVGAVLTIFIVTAFIGIPFALVGLALLGGGAGVTVWRYQNAKRTVDVMRNGQAVIGQVAGVDENLNVSINGRHPWRIRYRFQAIGRDYEGQVTTLHVPGRTLRPGSRAYVLYLPNEPQHNALYPHP